jgi:hypothetical protein
LQTIITATYDYWVTLLVKTYYYNGDFRVNAYDYSEVHISDDRSLLQTSIPNGHLLESGRVRGEDLLLPWNL